MTTTIDRLSDDVICHVLSFLPTKVSASTSILAKRWRFLWAHVPNLDFNGFDFEGPEIINRAIALHRAETMNTLSFSGNMAGGSPDQVPTWITHAINRGVRNLYIDIEIGYGFTVLPKCLLTSKTLVDVKLHWCIGFPSSGEVFFPSLRKLHLSSIVCDDEESLPHLLSGCPVLQDLIITGCSGQSFVFVYSLTIKRLDVQLDCSCCDRFSSVLNINAPSLEYLSVGNYYLENITVLRVMNSLIEAYLFLFGVPVYIDEEDEEEFDTEVHFLHCLCNAKCLKISIDGVWKLVKIAGLDSTVKFDNLTKLEIDSLFDFHELVKFLEAADNLQLLTFTLCGMHNAYREPKLVPTCMLLCLKTVRIKSGHVLIAKNDFESIRYVLKNGQVLERMEIHHSYPYRDSEKEELEMLERGSESCQLAFLLRI